MQNKVYESKTVKSTSVNTFLAKYELHSEETLWYARKYFILLE